jgi:hypothetical protein
MLSSSERISEGLEDASADGDEHVQKEMQMDHVGAVSHIA